MLRGLGRGLTARNLVAKGSGALPTDPLLLGAMVYGRLPEEKRRISDAMFASVAREDRAAALDKVWKARTPSNSEQIIRALGQLTARSRARGREPR